MKPSVKPKSKVCKKVYIAFFIIIILMISSEMIRQSLSEKHVEYSSVINKAGKQRMLSQSIAKNISLNIPYSNFKSQIEQLKINHEYLKSGMDLPISFNQKINKEYITVDKHLLNIDKAIGCYIENTCNDVKSRKKLIESFDLLTKEVDAIVNLISLNVTKSFKDLRKIELFIFGIIFLTIYLILRRIILPMQFDLIKNITSFEEAKEVNKKLEYAASIGTWELDILTGLTTWSDEVFRIYGLKKGKHINKDDAINFYKPKSQSKLLNYINEAISNSKGFNDEFEFIDAKGKEKWVRSVGEPLVDENGKIFKLIGVFQDITKKKKQEFKIKQTSDIFKIAIEGAKIGIWKWNMIEETVDCDDTWCGLYNISHQEMENDVHSWRKKIHPMDIENLYNDFKSYMKKETKSYENIHRTKDQSGGWRYILSRGKFTNYLDNGKPSSFIGTCQDVTDSIKSQNEQKLILSSLNLGIWKWNIPTNDLQWDDSLYKLYGYSKEDFNGAYEAWEKTLRADYKEKAKRELQDSLDGNSDFDTTFPINTKNGKEKFIGARAVIERDHNGKPIYMYGINWDKTDEILALKKLDQQRKISEQNAKLANIGEMAAGVGHEINNPLLIIKGYTEILKKEFESENLDKILNATHRIEQIVSGLRQFVRLTDNDNDDINLNNLLQTTYDTMVELYLKEDIKLELNLDTKAIIPGNFGRIQQVIVNLITNARDAVKENKNALIQINLKSTDNEYHIEVKDNGHGIPYDIQKRIFDPFFTTKDVNEGTGIGLSLVFSIIKDHNGKISLRSNTKGTTFKIRFPKVLTEGLTGETLDIKKIEENISRESILELQDLKILIVDDEKDILDILSFFLTEMNINVTAFNDPNLAYSSICENNYDLVITDLQMPKLSGPELVSKIRSNSNITQPQIIISTGGVNIDIEDKDNELTAMVNSYLFKPFDMIKLKSAIQSCYSTIDPTKS
jgi:PAS domain S-box-containing protein